MSVFGPDTRVGYGCASVNMTLTLDARDRIREETLTDDTQLVHRQFVYPDDT
jgi:hypothetical protein